MSLPNTHTTVGATHSYGVTEVISYQVWVDGYRYVRCSTKAALEEELKNFERFHQNYKYVNMGDAENAQ